MDQTNRQQIEVICDRLSDLRTMASKEGNGLLAHLIAETLEEAEKLRISAMKSLHWRAWLGPANRCVVPATSFSEYGRHPDPVTKKKPLHWFALNEDKPLFWFAGIWTSWYSVRKKKEGPVQADAFGFLTTDPNSVVAPIHPKAMPVILTTAEEIDVWMNAPAEEALQLQRPLPDGKLILLPQAEAEEPLLL